MIQNSGSVTNAFNDRHLVRDDDDRNTEFGIDLFKEL